MWSYTIQNVEGVRWILTVKNGAVVVHNMAHRSEAEAVYTARELRNAEVSRLEAEAARLRGIAIDKAG